MKTLFTQINVLTTLRMNLKIRLPGSGLLDPRRFITIRLDDHSKSFGSKLEKEIVHFGGASFRNKGRPLVGWIINNLSPLAGRVNVQYVRYSVVFAFHAYKVFKHEGLTGLVLHLKTSLVLIQQAIAGYVIEDQTELKRRVHRSRSGLPRWIPRSARSLLLSGDIRAVRFWTSCAALYRVLQIPGKLGLESITDPSIFNLETFMATWGFLWEEVLEVFWTSFMSLKTLRAMAHGAPTPFPINKTSPSSSHPQDTSMTPGFISSSAYSVIKSARSWLLNPLFSSLRDYSHPNFVRTVVKLAQQYHIDLDTNMGHSFFNWAEETLARNLLGIEKGGRLPIPYFSIFDASLHWRELSLKEIGIWARTWSQPYMLKSDVPRSSKFKKDPFILIDPMGELSTPMGIKDPAGGHWLGKLGVKLEPAGKVRLFAMVDPWTQWLLRPVHEAIFALLRKIPQDCTFDQVGKLEKVLQSVRAKGYRIAKAYSFDLSSATDRLPLILQQVAIEPLIPGRAILWGELLTSRDYLVPKGARKFSKTVLPVSVRYATGQPMGALSSWAMLAVIHHLIVQLSYAKFCYDRGIRYTWFTEYAVLGDDIVIFHPGVAKIYFALMTKVIGVKIGLAKSIQSTNRYVLEFAKKLWVGDKRAFMFPIRDIIVAKMSTAVLSEFIGKHDITFQHYLRIRGLGFKARDKVRSSRLWKLHTRARVYLVLWLRPQLPFFDWIRLRTPTTFFEFSNESLLLVCEELWRILSTRVVKKMDKAQEKFWTLTRKGGYTEYGVGHQYLMRLSQAPLGMFFDDKMVPSTVVEDLLNQRPTYESEEQFPFWVEPLAAEMKDPVIDLSDGGKWVSRVPSLYTVPKEYIATVLPEIVENADSDFNPGGYESFVNIPQQAKKAAELGFDRIPEAIDPSDLDEELEVLSLIEDYKDEPKVPVEGFKDLNFEQLWKVAEDLWKEIQKQDDAHESVLSPIGWFTQTRTAEARWTKFIGQYRLWVRLNTCFVKALQTSPKSKAAAAIRLPEPLSVEPSVEPTPVVIPEVTPKRIVLPPPVCNLCFDNESTGGTCAGFCKEPADASMATGRGIDRFRVSMTVHYCLLRRMLFVTIRAFVKVSLSLLIALAWLILYKELVDPFTEISVFDHAPSTETIFAPEHPSSKSVLAPPGNNLQEFPGLLILATVVAIVGLGVLGFWLFTGGKPPLDPSDPKILDPMVSDLMVETSGSVETYRLTHQIRASIDNDITVCDQIINTRNPAFNSADPLSGLGRPVPRPLSLPGRPYQETIE